MKSWCDLSWLEKCNIESGKVNSLNYLTGYTFDVKQKVEKGKKARSNPNEVQKTKEV